MVFHFSPQTEFVQVGDVDNDGQMEIVFGNSSGKLYIVNHDGSQQPTLFYYRGAPALVDIDGDQDLEIVFTTTTTSGGQLYAIHHNGITMSGFPKELGSMWTGPAVHDIDNDGVHDIICTTYDKEIYAIDVNGGAIKPSRLNRLDISPTVVDVDSDGDYEIAVGSGLTSRWNYFCTV